MNIYIHIIYIYIYKHTCIYKCKYKSIYMCTYIYTYYLGDRGGFAYVSMKYLHCRSN